MNHPTEQGGNPQDRLFQTPDMVNRAASSYVYPLPLGDRIHPPIQGPQTTDYTAELDIVDDYTLEYRGIEGVPSAYLDIPQIIVLNSLRSRPEKSFTAPELLRLIWREIDDTGYPYTLGHLTVTLASIKNTGRVFQLPLLFTFPSRGRAQSYRVNPAIRYVDYRMDSQHVVHLPDDGILSTSPPETCSTPNTPYEQLTVELATARQTILDLQQEVAVLKKEQKETAAKATEPPTIKTQAVAKLPAQAVPAPKKQSLVEPPPDDADTGAKTTEATNDLDELAPAEERNLLRRHQAITRIVGPFARHSSVRLAASRVLKEFGMDVPRASSDDYFTFNTAMFDRLQSAVTRLGGLDGLEAYDTSQNIHKNLDPAIVELVSSYQAIYQANMGIAVLTRHKYFGMRYGTMSSNDLDQAAYLGLSDAITRYDQRQKRFGTYAESWVRRRIQREVADTARAIRIPLHSYEAYNRIKGAAEELQQKLHREPLNTEVAASLGISEEKVIFFRKQTYDIPSLDRPVQSMSHDGTVLTLGDIVSDKADPDSGDAYDRAIEKVMADPLLVKALRGNNLAHREGYNLTKLQKVVVGLCCDITPAVIGNGVHLLVNGTLENYAVLYHRLQRLRTSDEEAVEVDIARVTGLATSSQTVAVGKAVKEVLAIKEEAFSRIIANIRGTYQPISESETA